MIFDRERVNKQSLKYQIYISVLHIPIQFNCNAIILLNTGIEFDNIIIITHIRHTSNN